VLPEPEEIMEMVAELSQELHDWLEVNKNADPEVVAAIQTLDLALDKHYGHRKGKQTLHDFRSLSAKKK